MTDAPERIGLIGLSRRGPWRLWTVEEDRGSPATAEYVRADVHDAALAAAEAETAAMRDVVEHAEVVMRYLSESGANVVPHLMDTDDNPGQRLRDALAALAPRATPEAERP